MHGSNASANNSDNHGANNYADKRFNIRSEMQMIKILHIHIEMLILVDVEIKYDGFILL